MMLFVSLAPLWGCSRSMSLEPQATPPVLAAQCELGDPSYASEDTIVAAAEFGVDYVDLVDRASDGHEDALRELLRLAMYVPMQQDASYGHCVAMALLLPRVGDEAFSMVLDREPFMVRWDVRARLRFAYGLEWMAPQADDAEAMPLFPLTAAAMSRFE